MMKRIMIAGYSGAGKSTMASHIGAALQIEPVHMDKIAWKSGWNLRKNEEASALLMPVLRQEHWIIEGNYKNILYEDRLALCDTLIFMNIGRMRCFWQVLKRRIRYNGVTRPDITQGCTEKLDLEFVKWVLWDGRKKTEIVFEDIKRCAGEQKKTLFVINSQAEAQSLLKTAQYYKKQERIENK